MRLQKYLADCGVSSRRRAEILMKKGLVTVNGILADKPGIKVNPDNDEIKVSGKIISRNANKIYILLNKPVKYITTARDDLKRKTVLNLVENEIDTRIYPVGRLDYNSEGLLILTNDGKLTYTLTHPKYEIPKTYMVQLNKAPSKEEIDRLRDGVIIDKVKTKEAVIKVIGGSVLEITITEGRNRQLRKMANAIGYSIISLKRVAIGEIKLGSLPAGGWRYLSSGEIKYLKGLI